LRMDVAGGKAGKKGSRGVVRTSRIRTLEARSTGRPGDKQVMFFASLKTRSPSGLTLTCPFGGCTMPPDQPTPAARRRGRQPKKTPHQVHTVSVRLTEAEHRELATEAKTYRKSMGEVLRSVWAGTPDVARSSRPRTVEEMAQLRQLIGMASNLNQLTKQLHAGHNVSEGARHVLGKLYRLLDELAPDSTR